MVSNENSNLEELKKSIESVGFGLDIEENELIFEINTKFTKNVLSNKLNDVSCSGSLDKSNSVLESILQLVVEKLVNIEFEGATRAETDQKEMLDKQPSEEKEDVKEGPSDGFSEPEPKPAGYEQQEPASTSKKKSDNQAMDLDVPPIPGSEDTNSQNNKTKPTQEDQEPPVPPGYEQQEEKRSSPKKPEASTGERDEESIKDVQILAINTQLELNKADYKELVSEAFAEAGIEVNEIPPLEQLTYKQAIEVIKYGNRKFKK